MPDTSPESRERFRRLSRWVAEQLGVDGSPRLELVAGDASFRRYYRLSAGGVTRIVMDAPPPQEDVAPFIDRLQRLAAGGLHVPQLYAADARHGFLLLEDLGDTQYLHRLDADTVSRLYADALTALRSIQSQPTTGLPRYDAAALEREMHLFPDWFLDRHHRIALSHPEQEALQQVFETLIAAICPQPHVFVHRDYHSRNLMVTDTRNPGILDFQDAVAGPLTYDLVSLLRDCYVAWPVAQVNAWVADYHAQLPAIGLADDIPWATFQRWFDLTGIQRHLKAIGIFARLNHRDGKPGYLGAIPRTLNYILEVGAAYPEVAPLLELVQRHGLAEPPP
jgi:hypothetical protein